MISKLHKFAVGAFAAVAFTLAGLAGSAVAQSYPHDTVTLVTHSKAGGGTDVFLREMTRYLGKYLGANFVVDNATGGSGAKAMAKLATSPADGSIFYGTTPTFINTSVSYTHLRAHETDSYLVCRLLL